MFAPLGVKIGAKRLAAAAERFGFNETAADARRRAEHGAARARVDSPLAVGAAAIGQDKDLATPLQMAVVAATIASRGVRHRADAARARAARGTASA